MRTTRKSKAGHLPDGAGGTIAGGPMRPIDLMGILTRAPAPISVGGAVSGAAGKQAPEPVRTGKGIALSDGSLIEFTSLPNRQILEDA